MLALYRNGISLTCSSSAAVPPSYCVGDQKRDVLSEEAFALHASCPTSNVASQKALAGMGIPSEADITPDEMITMGTLLAIWIPDDIRRIPLRLLEHHVSLPSPTRERIQHALLPALLASDGYDTLGQLHPSLFIPLAAALLAQQQEEHEKQCASIDMLALVCLVCPKIAELLAPPLKSRVDQARMTILTRIAGDEMNAFHLEIFLSFVGRAFPYEVMTFVTALPLLAAFPNDPEAYRALERCKKISPFASHLLSARLQEIVRRVIEGETREAPYACARPVSRLQ